MRVEKFSLFFPPTLASVKRGETEYAIGAIPAGGYVKISGMNPSEDLPDEVRTRAYYSQPVWKRIVVISAARAHAAGLRVRGGSAPDAALRRGARHHGRPVLVHHQGHARAPAEADRPGAARGDPGGGGLLRDDSADHPQRPGGGDRDPRDHLPVAGDPDLPGGPVERHRSPIG